MKFWKYSAAATWQDQMPFDSVLCGSCSVQYRIAQVACSTEASAGGKRTAAAFQNMRLTACPSYLLRKSERRSVCTQYLVHRHQIAQRKKKTTDDTYPGLNAIRRPLASNLFRDTASFRPSSRQAILRILHIPHTYLAEFRREGTPPD